MITVIKLFRCLRPAFGALRLVHARVRDVPKPIRRTCNYTVIKRNILTIMYMCLCNIIHIYIYIHLCNIFIRRTRF